METREKSRRSTATVLEQPSCSTAAAAVVLDGNDSMGQQQSHEDGMIHSHHHRVTSSTVRNIEIDWREVDPYFSELSDCASFWTLINFTCDIIYSSLFVLFFLMGQDVESMFFEGLLNHINPILIYLILSLIINYGALRSLRCGREKCFLTFSIGKALLFPVTISLLLYLVFADVQNYFGTFWVSFVVIVSCYNLTAALGLWSMFTCNKYILVNEAAQKRIRKQATHQQRSGNNEKDCRCGCACANIIPPSSATTNNCSVSQCASSSRTCNSHSRKIGDSSCANNVIVVCKTDNSSSTINTSRIPSNVNVASSNHPDIRTLDVHSSLHATNKPANGSVTEGSLSSVSTNPPAKRDSFDEDGLSFEEDEVLEISTVHKVMQEIRLLDNSTTADLGQGALEEGDSL